MLVEPNRKPQIKLTRLDRAVGSEHRRATRRAPIGDIDKGNAGKSQLRHHRVGVPRSIRSAERELNVRPCQPRAIECLPDGDDSLLKARQTGCTAEGMDSCTDNEDIVAHAPCPSSAVNPKLVRSEPSASRKGSGTTRIAIPISNASNATSTRRPSTINAPSSSI